MKCKHCKQVFTPVRWNQKYCFEPLCLEIWIATEHAKQWRVKKTRMKKELMSLQDWLKIAQQTFNKWIRHRDKGLPCISCGHEPKKANAGHFFSQGGHSNVRFHEDNVHLQCEHCNSFLSGNLISYREGLLKRIGIERYTELEKVAHRPRKWQIDELKELIETYKQKLKE